MHLNFFILVSMREDLLHFIWKYKKLATNRLFTTRNEPIEVIKVGDHNELAGPDFFNAQLRISGQLWAGNLEIHLKSSDWYAHSHELDPAYENVILHVVWEHNSEVFLKNGQPLATLELKNFISEKVLHSYKELLVQNQVAFINCERDIHKIDSFKLNNWFERLYIERLEQKSILVKLLLDKKSNGWEEVLFQLLLKSFGSKVNGELFLKLSEKLDFKIVRKLQGNVIALESIFYGMLGMLDSDEVNDKYYQQLKSEFLYHKKKFQLQEVFGARPQFFGLRPNNFPTVRLSQLASLYAGNHSLFNDLMHTADLNGLYSILTTQANEYWNSHYTFGKVSGNRKKTITKNFIDILIINAVLPLRFLFAQSRGENPQEAVLPIIEKMACEKNSIISNFKSVKVELSNALQGQAALQLYNEYCHKNRCLKCAVGADLLSGNF